MKKPQKSKKANSEDSKKTNGKQKTTELSSTSKKENSDNSSLLDEKDAACVYKCLDKDDYEELIFNKNEHRNTLVKCLDIVKKYIINNDLILTGGMAIDLALRNKGSKLYKDTKIPDYDFYSPKFYFDAYNIGNILAREFSGVDVIMARHVSTMRVRVSSVPVADITYIPPNVYEKIPTIKYENIRIVHPWYQMIDQHLALTLPFENPPVETIMNRWKKDIERYDILCNHYPVESKDVEEKESVLYEIDCSDIENECIAGVPGLYYWINHAKSLGFKLKGKLKYAESFSINKKIVSVKLSYTFPFTLLSDDFEKTLEKFKGNTKYYKELIDKITRKVIVEQKKSNKIEILDNRGMLTTAHKVSISGVELTIANLQHIMCYLLTFGVFYNNDEAINHYLVAQELLYWAASNYTDSNKKYDVFLPTTETYGKYNWGNTYIAQRERELTFIREIKREQNMPQNVYPEKGTEISPEYYKFDPRQSKYYQIDGEITEPFHVESLVGTKKN